MCSFCCALTRALHCICLKTSFVQVEADESQIEKEKALEKLQLQQANEYSAKAAQMKQEMEKTKLEMRADGINAKEKADAHEQAELQHEQARVKQEEKVATENEKDARLKAEIAVTQKGMLRPELDKAVTVLKELKTKISLKKIDVSREKEKARQDEKQAEESDQEMEKLEEAEAATAGSGNKALKTETAVLAEKQKEEVASSKAAKRDAVTAENELNMLKQALFDANEKVDALKKKDEQLGEVVDTRDSYERDQKLELKVAEDEEAAASAPGATSEQVEAADDHVEISKLKDDMKEKEDIAKEDTETTQKLVDMENSDQKRIEEEQAKQWKSAKAAKLAKMSTEEIHREVAKAKQAVAATKKHLLEVTKSKVAAASSDAKAVQNALARQKELQAKKVELELSMHNAETFLNKSSTATEAAAAQLLQTVRNDVEQDADRAVHLVEQKQLDVARAEHAETEAAQQKTALVRQGKAAKENLATASTSEKDAMSKLTHATKGVAVANARLKVANARLKKAQSVFEIAKLAGNFTQAVQTQLDTANHEFRAAEKAAAGASAQIKEAKRLSTEAESKLKAAEENVNNNNDAVRGVIDKIDAAKKEETQLSDEVKAAKEAAEVSLEEQKKASQFSHLQNKQAQKIHAEREAAESEALNQDMKASSDKLAEAKAESESKRDVTAAEEAKEDARTLEVTEISARTAAADASVAKENAKKEVAEATSKVQSAEDALHDAQSQGDETQKGKARMNLERAKETLSEAQERFVELTRTAKEAQDKKTKTKLAVEQAEGDVKDLESEVKKAKSDAADLKKKADADEDKVVKAKEMLKTDMAMEKKVTDTESKAEKSKEKRLEKKKKDAAASVQQAKTDEKQAESKKNAATTALHASEKELGDNETKIDKLTKEEEEAKQQVQEAELNMKERSQKVANASEYVDTSELKLSKAKVVMKDPLLTAKKGLNKDSANITYYKAVSRVKVAKEALAFAEEDAAKANTTLQDVEEKENVVKAQLKSLKEASSTAKTDIDKLKRTVKDTKAVLRNEKEKVSDSVAEEKQIKQTEEADKNKQKEMRKDEVNFARKESTKAKMKSIEINEKLRMATEEYKQAKGRIQRHNDLLKKAMKDSRQAEEQQNFILEAKRSQQDDLEGKAKTTEAVYEDATKQVQASVSDVAHLKAEENKEAQKIQAVIGDAKQDEAKMKQLEGQVSRLLAKKAPAQVDSGQSARLLKEASTLSKDKKLAEVAEHNAKKARESVATTGMKLAKDENTDRDASLSVQDAASKAAKATAALQAQTHKLRGINSARLSMANMTNAERAKAEATLGEEAKVDAQKSHIEGTLKQEDAELGKDEAEAARRAKAAQETRQQLDSDKRKGANENVKENELKREKKEVDAQAAMKMNSIKAEERSIEKEMLKTKKTIAADKTSETLSIQQLDKTKKSLAFANAELRKAKQLAAEEKKKDVGAEKAVLKVGEESAAVSNDIAKLKRQAISAENIKVADGAKLEKQKLRMEAAKDAETEAETALKNGPGDKSLSESKEATRAAKEVLSKKRGELEHSSAVAKKEQELEAKEELQVDREKADVKAKAAAVQAEKEGIIAAAKDVEAMQAKAEKSDTKVLTGAQGSQAKTQCQN